MDNPESYALNASQARCNAAIDALRAPYEAECNRVIGSTSGLLYRRGNFNGTWDDLICQGIIEERDEGENFFGVEEGTHILE